MAFRRWDERYPPSVPRPVAGGVATTRQRGPMATTWWSRRFIEVLDSYGLGARMQRGRRYARSGQVIAVEVTAGMVAAQVQGSRAQPYTVTARLSVPTDRQWASILDAMRAKVGFVARLLDGEVPPELEEVFAAAGVALFPDRWAAFGADCTCPDWENPCKHLAAVLYVLADRLDGDPWLALLLRGRDREALLDALAAGGTPSAPAGPEIAPWWPFGPGPLPADLHAGADPPSSFRPAQPAAVLDTLEPLDVVVGAAPFVDLVRPLYDHLG